jgi:hypothetical protein
VSQNDDDDAVLLGGMGEEEADEDDDVRPDDGLNGSFSCRVVSRVSDDKQVSMSMMRGEPDSTGLFSLEISFTSLVRLPSCRLALDTRDGELKGLNSTELARSFSTTSDMAILLIVVGDNKGEGVGIMPW